jgi:hypothetical protein
MLLRAANRKHVYSLWKTGWYSHCHCRALLALLCRSDSAINYWCRRRGVLFCILYSQFTSPMVGCLYVLSCARGSVDMLILCKLSRSRFNGKSHWRRSWRWWLVLEWTSGQLSATRSLVLSRMWSKFKKCTWFGDCNHFGSSLMQMKLNRFWYKTMITYVHGRALVLEVATYLHSKRLWWALIFCATLLLLLWRYFYWVVYSLSNLNN